jgi:hypothetical protein
MRIFVSSSFEDLREHRAAAIRVLRQLGHEVLAMEDMIAGSAAPLAKVMEMVDRSEAYVGVFAALWLCPWPRRPARAAKETIMLKKIISFSLVALLLHVVSAVPARAAAPLTQKEAQVEKVKAEVAKRGLGTKARVTVKLQNGSKLKGYISKAEADSFTLSDSRTGQTTTLAYRDVVEVKKQGGLSLAAKLGIGLAITVGALALLYAIGCGNDPYC